MKNDGLIDLHTHSNYSDGEKEPNDLLKYAFRQGIKTISITDHDTILGNKKIDFNDPIIKKMRVITGIELSASIDYGRLHILGYNIDIKNNSLNQRMQELKDSNIHNLLNIAKQIEKDHQDITFNKDDIYEIITRVGNVGRPDIAKLLMKYGAASYVEEAFQKYLIKAYDKVRSKNIYLEPDECINLIKSAGGIPVLAHPNTLKRKKQDLILLINRLMSYGLEGIEVYHSQMTKEETSEYIDIAHKYNLLCSGGTDYHGPIVKPLVEIGTGINGNIKIKKLNILDKINN